MVKRFLQKEIVLPRWMYSPPTPDPVYTCPAEYLTGDETWRSIYNRRIRTPARANWFAVVVVLSVAGAFTRLPSHWLRISVAWLLLVIGITSPVVIAGHMYKSAARCPKCNADLFNVGSRPLPTIWPNLSGRVKACPACRVDFDESAGTEKRQMEAQPEN